MTIKAKSAKPARPVQARQKPSATSARVVDRNILSRARRRARDITRLYPMRQWAKWTHHQKHGWWSHVVSGDFEQIRFTRRDMDDLTFCWQRCMDETRLDAEINTALDAIRERQTALDVAVDDLRQLVRRKARAQ